MTWRRPGAKPLSGTMIIDGQFTDAYMRHLDSMSWINIMTYGQLELQQNLINTEKFQENAFENVILKSWQFCKTWLNATTKAAVTTTIIIMTITMKLIFSTSFNQSHFLSFSNSNLPSKGNYLKHSTHHGQWSTSDLKDGEWSQNFNYEIHKVLCPCYWYACLNIQITVSIFCLNP